MSIRELAKVSLCSRDYRSPIHNFLDEEDREEEPMVSCMCDNCFYGRSRMADFILEHLDGLNP